MKRREYHGRRHTREYEIWKSMIQRCHNPRNKNYHNYGGRGIVVSEQWRGSFGQFYADMGPMPHDGMSVERKENCKGYEPSNCVWATQREQAANKRNNRVVELDGQSLHLMEWERRTGIPYCVIGRRLDRGWSERDALSTPTKTLRRCSVVIDGKSHSLHAAAKILGIPQSTMHKWFVQEGLSVQEILKRRHVHVA